MTVHYCCSCYTCFPFLLLELIRMSIHTFNTEDRNAGAVKKPLPSTPCYSWASVATSPASIFRHKEGCKTLRDHDWERRKKLSLNTRVIIREQKTWFPSPTWPSVFTKCVAFSYLWKLSQMSLKLTKSFYEGIHNHLTILECDQKSV